MCVASGRGGGCAIGGRLVTFADTLGHRPASRRLRGKDPRGAEDVVRQREPEEYGSRFCKAAHRDLAQIEPAPARIDAFGDGAAFVAFLAGRALHAAAPGQHAFPIAATRCERIGLMLASGRRAMHGHPLAMRPLDVVCGGEAAIGEVAARQAAVACAHLPEHGAGEAAIGARCRDIDSDDDLAFDGARDLHVVGGPEAAIGGPIALLQDGDIIEIDAVVGTLNVKLTDAELAERKTKWKARETNHTSGALWKYAQQVGPAVGGAVTHPGGAHEKQCYADI